MSALALLPVHPGPRTSPAGVYERRRVRADVLATRWAHLNLATPAEAVRAIEAHLAVYRGGVSAEATLAGIGAELALCWLTGEAVPAGDAR